MKTTVYRAADGRELVCVTFTPSVPNPAQQCDVDTIFDFVRSEAFHPVGDPFALVQISCTLVDSREPYTLSRTQRDAVIQSALDKLAESA